MRLDSDCEKKLMVAIVGLGKMGFLHSCILKTLPKVKFVAVCDKGKLLRKVSRKIFKDVRIASDVTELAGLEIDAVYVTTPIPSHFDIIKTICSMKIARHIFVEKTLAANLDETKEMLALARNFVGTNMVGYMKRYSVTFKKAKELLDQNVLGDITGFYGYAYSSDFAQELGKSKAPSARGGALEDLGSHIIDIALWYLGDLRVEKVANKIKALNDEIATHFSATTPAGISGEFDVSWNKTEYRMPEFRLSVYGREGFLSVDDDEVRLRLKGKKLVDFHRQDLMDSVGFLIDRSEYYREDESFINAVSSGSLAYPDFLEASRTDRLIHEVKNRVR